MLLVWFRFFVIGMTVVTGYLILSVPFSIVCIARPAVIGARLLLIICDTVSSLFLSISL